MLIMCLWIPAALRCSASAASAWKTALRSTAPSVPFRRTRRRSLAWRFVDARIDYLNCRDAISRDIMFRDCEMRGAGRQRCQVLAHRIRWDTNRRALLAACHMCRCGFAWRAATGDSQCRFTAWDHHVFGADRRPFRGVRTKHRHPHTVIDCLRCI